MQDHLEKTKEQLETPGPDTYPDGSIIPGSDDVLVSYPPDFNYSDSPAATKYHKKENKPLSPFFEQLKKRGIKITSYDVRDGAERPITEED